MSSHSSPQACWSCQHWKNRVLGALFEELADSEYEADLKSAIEEKVLPSECRTCQGKERPMHRALRELYLDIIDTTQEFWRTDAGTDYSIHGAAVPTAHRDAAEKLCSSLQAELTKLGFIGFFDHVIVTRHMPQTIAVVLRHKRRRDLNDVLSAPSPGPRTPASILPAGGPLPDSQVRWWLENLPAANLVLEIPSTALRVGSRNLIVNLSIAELAGDDEYAAVIRSRLRLELLQVILEHMRAVEESRLAKDMHELRTEVRGEGRAAGNRLPKPTLALGQLACEFMREGAVHSLRYRTTPPHRVVLPSSPPKDIEKVLALIYLTYWQVMKDGTRQHQKIAHLLYYHRIRTAVIETLAKAYANRDGSSGALPPIGAAAAALCPELAMLFDALRREKLGKPFAYDRGDVRDFVKRVVLPNHEVFRELLKLEREQSEVCRILAGHPLILTLP